jgi:hypothetical protein
MSSSQSPSRRKYVKSGAFANRYTKGKDSKYIPVAQQRAAAAAAAAVQQVQVQEVQVQVQVQEVAVPEVQEVAVAPVAAEVMAYPNQIAAAKQIIAAFKDGYHWTVLLAFPQSGKTQTFYYVASDMLCNRPDIDRVVVVCGNAENELSAQLRASKTEFIRLYVQTEHAYLSADHSESVIRTLEARIQVWCGADLKNNTTHPTSARNTLFIWEEAHYAQDKTNRPHKFFKNLCITADGEISNLEGERNNYVLTVSATPFSELSNIWHHGQKKRVVRLEPAQGYKGPRHFLAAGAIVQFDPRLSCEEVVAQAIAEAPIMAAPKYAIVRVRDYKGKDNMAACIRVAVEHGWAYRVYDSETKYNQANSMQSMDELAVAPECNTLILIRGMCRMGKRVPKEHISFVIETSKDSDTDTVLQALLGRMFGYHDNMTIKVYISRNIQLAEIDRYVRMMENPDDMPLQTMPRRGKNLVAGSHQSDNGWFNNVPIIVRADADAEEEHDDDPNAAEYEKELTIRAIQAAFETGAAENHNCADQTAEIRQQIMQLTAEPDRMSAKNFMNRRGNRINDTYKDMPDKLRDSIAQRSPLNAGSSAGCGFESNREDGMQVNVWRCNTHQFSQSHGFYPGDLIVDTRTRVPSPEQQLHVRIPCTTGSETFSTQQEDGAVVIGNGGYSIPLAVETSHDAVLMQLNLCDLIRESQIQDSLQRPKCVTSNHGGVHAAHDGVSEWKGIIVTVEILQALQRGGAIYEYIKREHGATLKITKVLGRELKSLKNMGNARLTKIEWS